MTTFTINEQNEIVAFPSAAEAAAATATPFDIFSSEPELAELASTWPGKRLVEIWNSLPGVTPVRKFTNHHTAIRRLWALQFNRPQRPRQNPRTVWPRTPPLNELLVRRGFLKLA